MQSHHWYLDEIFKVFILRFLSCNIIFFLISKTFFIKQVVPTLLFQLFTILGSFFQNIRGVEQSVVLPLVFSLMSKKTEAAYAKVLAVVKAQCQQLNIPTSLPQKTMTDFELAIINAVNTELGEATTCLFHLGSLTGKKTTSHLWAIGPNLNNGYKDVGV